MEHLGTKTIETPRLVLRRFAISDAPAMLRNWADDPEVTRFLTWPPHAEVSVTERVVSGWVENYARADWYQWAIVLRELGEPIGSISAVRMSEAAEKVEIGYCIGRAWWGRGLTAEALAAVRDFFLDEVGFNRVEAKHDTRNLASGAVMRKCGLRYEGAQRQADRNNLGLCDVCLYGIVAGDERRPL